MTPTNSDNSEKLGEWLSSPPEGEEVVISGISGSLPECNDLYEFRDALFNKKDLVTENNRRWDVINDETPKRMGTMLNIDKFDPGYFGIHYRQAHNMDPALRILMETSIQAIMDAGLRPSELEGTKTGVFVGFTASDSGNAHLMLLEEPNTFAGTGFLKFFLPQRLAFYMKLKGPAYTTDTACSSSLNALEHAFRAIRMGECENAIVGGVNLITQPGSTLQFFRLGVLSPEGKCRIFDKDANGYVRSEGAVSVFLQKAKNANRIYAQIVHAKMNGDGYKQEGITFPSAEIQSRLMTEVLEESKVHPSELSYLEAHGTGTAVGDPEETMAIDDVFGRKRNKPLWVGSVKSNIGHGEPVSGISAVAKVILCLESGYIAPNIHFTELRPGLEGFEKGRLKVVTETTPILEDRAVVGINNFGFGGSNCHILLRRIAKKQQNIGLENLSTIPRIVCITGRTKEGAQTILNDLTSRALNIEYVALLQRLFSKPAITDMYRGFAIISNEGVIKADVKRFKLSKASLTIFFGDLEQNYKILGRYSIKIQTFKNCMLRINNCLKGTSINVLDLIQTMKKDSVYDKFGALSVQLGLVEILKELSVNPTKLCGEYFGRLVCAYYEEKVSLKEAVLTSLEILKLYNGTLSRKLVENYLSKFKYSNLVQPKKNNLVLNVSDTDNFGLNLIDKNKNCVFLETLGSLYVNGYDVQVAKLYPKVEFPVSWGTPMISPLIKFNHDKSWYTLKFTEFKSIRSEQATYSFTRLDSEFTYLEGHVVNGRNLFPATGYLNLVWETLITSRGLTKEDFCITFENCRFIKATTYPQKGFLKLFVMIQKKSGNFVVLEGDDVVVTGKIYSTNKENVQSSLPVLGFNSEDEVLDQDDVYKELRLRGYDYSGLFKSITKCDVSAEKGLIQWHDNWIVFMDNMLQIKILQYNTRSLYVPTAIDRLTIDPHKHREILNSLGDNLEIPVTSYETSNIIKTEGIEIFGLQASAIARRKPTAEPVLEKYLFVPNETNDLNLEESLRSIIQIILENTLDNNVKAVEILSESYTKDSSLILPIVSRVLEDVPLAKPDLIISSKIEIEDCLVRVEPVVLTNESNCCLIVGSRLLQQGSNAKHIFNGVAKNGFILSRESRSFKQVEDPDVEIITVHQIDDETLVLCRKRQDTPDKLISIEITSNDKSFDWLSNLQSALNQKGLNVIIYSQNEATSGILGLINCIRREPGGNRVRGFFVADQKAPKFSVENGFYAKQLKKYLGVNVYKDSKWGTYRHLLVDCVEEVESEHCFINNTVKGDLSSLHWFEGPLSKTENVLVHYTAINFKDVMLASGRISADSVTRNRLEQELLLGFEFSGVDSQGQRVMGMTSAGALATIVKPDPSLLWLVPDSWTLQEAATVTVVYGTVIYALLMRATLKPGKKILIHSGTGGIGIAAINVALHFGCEIFVTVGTKEKREFLRTNYPQIEDSHIGNSRDTSFEEMIKEETLGQGVDIVLNSLAEEKLLASVRCLARGGQFMEIGKFDMANNNPLQMLFMEKEASFHGVMLDRLFKESTEVKLKFAAKIHEGLKKGYVKPLPRTVFKSDEVEKAFRYMSTGTHIGKVLVKVRDEYESKEKTTFKGISRFTCDPDKSYVILGGLGGFGLELLDWLVLRGAKRVIITSTRGISSGYQRYRINSWKAYGVQVEVINSTSETKESCWELIEKATKHGPVDGIFNLAVNLKDALLGDQSVETFQQSFAPKTDATRYLDEATRKLCPNLRYFVVFSSVSCGRGNIGQTNYGMANSVMERICEERRKDGLPGLAIQWGVIGDVGLVAKMQKNNMELEIGGTLQQKISNCLEVLDKFLQQTEAAVVSSMVVAEKRTSASSGNLIETVANILGIKDIKTITQQATLAELGMDSMTATEIIQVLEKDFEIYVTAKDVRVLTFARLIELQEEKWSDDKDDDEIIQKGVRSIIRFLPDNSLGDSPIIKMTSKLDEAKDCPLVFVLPGIEGALHLLEPLTKELNAHVYGLQYNYKNPEDCIDDIVVNLLPHIEAKIAKNKKFFVMGYSFGTIVGPEIVNKLEVQGHICDFIAIEGSSDYLITGFQQTFGESDSAEYDTSVILTLLPIFLPAQFILEHKVGIPTIRTEKIVSLLTFNEKLDYIDSILPENLPNRDKFNKQAAIVMQKRIRAALTHQNSSQKLKTQVYLFRASNPIIHGMSEDYNFSQIVEKPVKVREIEGDHNSVLESPDLVESVNKILQ